MTRGVARSRAKWFGVARALVGALLAAAVGVWVVHLDRVVTREFQGRHWSVPARVFAAPLELYVGAPVAAGDLEEELRRLHYRSGDPAAGPGIYRRRGNSFDLQARRVRFSDESREPLTLSIGATAVTFWCPSIASSMGRRWPSSKLTRGNSSISSS